MNFSENTNLLPGGQSASPSKLKELVNKIEDLAQTVTSVADSVADLADEVTTAELNATSANVTNAVIDNATVGEETVTTVNATTVNADNLNATDADITNLTADDVEANSVDADNGYFGSVNAQSFTGSGVDIAGNITARDTVQGVRIRAQERLITPNLESTFSTELGGLTTVRGDVYFPETGDKIYGEYLEVEANKVDANTVKVNSLTTETPTDSSQLVGYDANGKLIPVDAGLDPANYWEPFPGEEQQTIQPKDGKNIYANAVNTGYLWGDTVAARQTEVQEDFIVVGKTTLKNTEVDGDLTVNGDIIQNGSAYETHAEKVYSKNDLIITRDGAVSRLSKGQYTGIQAKKYDGTNDGQLVFDKDGEARVGDVGDTEPLMTRDELADMTDGSLLKWDGTNKKAVCGKSADIIPSDATSSNKLATNAALSVTMASGTTLSGVAISAGSIVRVLFTADLTGSDATTGLTLTYNGNAYAVKVGKNGALAAFVASEVSSGVFKYLQAYTTLELIFDGTQFIIIGAPVVLSSANYTIYADGRVRQYGTVDITGLSLGGTMTIATFMGSTLESINAIRMHSDPSTAIYNFGYVSKTLTVGYMDMGSSGAYATDGYVYYEMIGTM